MTWTTETRICRVLSVDERKNEHRTSRCSARSDAQFSLFGELVLAPADIIIRSPEKMARDPGTQWIQAKKAHHNSARGQGRPGVFVRHASHSHARWSTRPPGARHVWRTVAPTPPPGNDASLSLLRGAGGLHPGPDRKRT